MLFHHLLKTNEMDFKTTILACQGHTFAWNILANACRGLPNAEKTNDSKSSKNHEKTQKTPWNTSFQKQKKNIKIFRCGAFGVILHVCWMTFTLFFSNFSMMLNDIRTNFEWLLIDLWLTFYSWDQTKRNSHSESISDAPGCLKWSPGPVSSQFGIM